MFFLCYHPLFREEFATCSPVAQPMALESFIMRSARWMGLKRKNGLWDMCWGDMTGWRIRYSHRNPWTLAVTIFSLNGHGAPLLRQLLARNGYSLSIMNKGRCEYERRGVKYIRSNKIRKEHRNIVGKSRTNLVGNEGSYITRKVCDLNRPALLLGWWKLGW